MNSDDHHCMPRRHLIASLWLGLLPGCAKSEDDERAKKGLPPLTEDQKRLKQKFRGMKGGQLVVDAFGVKDAVTIFNELGKVFFTASNAAQNANDIRSYGAEFGVPISLRATWRREGVEVNGVIQNPIRVAEQYGIFTGGTVVGDYTVPVAERIPEEVLEGIRNKVGGFRLKIRLHDDGCLIGWDLSRGFNLQYLAGGDFREADRENGIILRKGWYIHPKTGQKIETDF